MKRFFIRAIALAVMTLLSVVTESRASLPNKFYYWVTPSNYYSGEKESFVIEVDPSRSTEIQALLAQNIPVGFSGHVAAGGVLYNKDYYSPERRVWNWHVVSVDWIFDSTKTYFPESIIPNLDANPSDIAVNPDEWISKNGDIYTPRHYQITTAIDPTQIGLVVNVSNRGLTGQGENTLITGFVVQGGEPRNVVVRMLGPTLQNNGIQRVATNPAIELYQGSVKIAANADWMTDARADVLKQTGLQPASEKEAALYLTVLPGAYTVHASNEDAGEGIALIEVYDVDGPPPPFHGQ